MSFKQVYRSEAELGEVYRDTDTGFVGTACAVTFFQHGCERVSLKGINTNGEVVEFSFDAAELERDRDREQVKLIEQKTGGPHDRAAIRRR